VGLSLLSASIRSCSVVQGQECVLRSKVIADQNPLAHLPWEDIHPPSLYYTVIAYDGPLRTRGTQNYLDELENFRARVGRARELLSGWLVTLYHLMASCVMGYPGMCLLHVVRPILQRP